MLLRSTVDKAGTVDHVERDHHENGTGKQDSLHSGVGRLMLTLLLFFLWLAGAYSAR